MMKKLREVLLIDDDQVNNLFCQIVIEHLDISSHVHSCLSGFEGLDYLANCFDQGRPAPELILLDISMPQMDGFDFLCRYRELGYDRLLPSKICMLTSSDMEADIRRAMEPAFVIGFITKPLSEYALQQVLAKLAVG